MKFINYLLDIAEIWDNLDEYLNIETELLKIFHKFNEELLDLHTTYNAIKNIITANFNNIKRNFIAQIEPNRFIVEIVNSIYNKFLTLKKRLYKLLILNSKIDLQEELIEQFKQGQIDLMHSLFYSDERATFGFFTDSYYPIPNYFPFIFYIPNFFFHFTKNLIKKIACFNSSGIIFCNLS